MAGSRVLVGLLLAVGLSCARPRAAASVVSATEPPSARSEAGNDSRSLDAPSAVSPAILPRDAFQAGYATWYGQRFAGRMTSNGERFDPNQMTAAHRSLPFGTWVEVKRVDTGKAVRVRITDRGPWGHEERIIDLSRSAAQKLGIVKTGVARVELRIVGGP